MQMHRVPDVAVQQVVKEAFLFVVGDQVIAFIRMCNTVLHAPVTQALPRAPTPLLRGSAPACACSVTEHMTESDGHGSYVQRWCKAMMCACPFHLSCSTSMQALSCTPAAQVLEARVDWAVWALDQGIVQAGELAPPAAPAAGQAAHVAAALQRFLEAALVAEDGAGGERRGAMLGLEHSMRRLAVRGLELLNKVATGFRRVCCV